MRFEKFASWQLEKLNSCGIGWWKCLCGAVERQNWFFTFFAGDYFVKFRASGGLFWGEYGSNVTLLCFLLFTRFIKKFSYYTFIFIIKNAFFLFLNSNYCKTIFLKVEPNPQPWTQPRFHIHLFTNFTKI